MKDDLISRISLRQSIVTSMILADGKTLDQIIDEEPSVDAVEVVRCKDCKHRGAKTINEFGEYEVVFPDDVCPCQCDDYFYSWMPDDDWFCKNGERKEE